MEQTNYDELAKFLREMADRFGDTAFTDRRRLVSLLSDRMPEARREIRVVGSAVDEHVFEVLSRARPEQLGMEIERLGSNLENGLGIRSDVAIPVIRACAYGLSLGPLPSGQAAAAPPPPPPDQSWVGDTRPSDSWVGISEPVAQAAPAQPGSPVVAAPAMQPPGAVVPPPGGPPAVPTPPANAAKKKWLVNGSIAVVIILAVLRIFGHVTPDPSPQPQPQPQPQPTPQPVRPPTPQPVIQPTPAPTPTPTPAPVPQIQARPYGNETFDFHIPPQSGLKSPVGGPTPTTIPGATTVVTVQIFNELRNNHTLVLIDSLADQHDSTIKGAIYLPFAGRPGTFNDQVETTLTNALNQIVQGHRDLPLIFFCQGINCWESYNAALRAHAAGFPNVYWYRGGLVAWEDAGLPMQPLQ